MAVTNGPHARSATGAAGGNGLNSTRRGRVEQDCLVEVQSKHMALPDTEIGIRPHPRGNLLAGDRGDNESVRSGWLNNLDLAREGRDALGVLVRTFEIADSFRTNAEDDPCALAEGSHVRARWNGKRNRISSGALDAYSQA
jgi:hypothetical protein